MVQIPDGLLIIIGGYNAEADAAIDSVECLSLNKLQNGWRNIAALPEPICASAAVYFHDVVIIAGGEGEDERLLSTVYALKPPQLPLLNDLFTFREFGICSLTVLKPFTSCRL